MWFTRDSLGTGGSPETQPPCLQCMDVPGRETKKSLLLTGHQCAQRSGDSLEESGVECGMWAREASRGGRGWCSRPSRPSSQGG